MTLKNPEYLLMILAAGAAIFIGYLILSLRGERIIRILGGRRQLVSRGSKITGFWTMILRGIVLSLIFMLFAGAYWLSPQIERVSELPVYEGAEICFVIDASRSSRAMDISFIDVSGREIIMSRFEFAKKIVLESKSMLSPDDIPCLVFFAASAINTFSAAFEFPTVAWSYIVYDMNYADDYFIEYEIPQGSDFVPMMKKVLSAFSDKPRRKIAIIISDGEQEVEVDISNLEEEDARKLLSAKKTGALKDLKKEIAEFGKKYELSTDILGIGNTKRASRIPKKVKKDGSIVTYHVFESGKNKGQAVLTRPDPEFLFQVARSIGGKYRHVTTFEEAKKELSQIFTREKKVLFFKEKKNISDIWWQFVFAGTVLLFVVPFLKSP